jgi:cation transport regulator ChaC
MVNVLPAMGTADHIEGSVGDRGAKRSRNGGRTRLGGGRGPFRGPRYGEDRPQTVAWVFGYGSLVPAGVAALPDGAVPCRLSGWRRGWDVAMDNGRDLPGYKHYLTPDGERPDVMVAFLDIAPHEGGLVNGAAIPIEQRELPDLDRRERNYRRVDVTDQLDTRLPGGGTVWAYVGLRASRERAVRGRREGRLVVPRGYYERVRDGFAAIGERAAFSRLTGPLMAPVADLVLVRHAPVTEPRATRAAATAAA